MLRFRDYSITKKLTWMNMLVSGTALLLACGAFTIYETVLYRQTMVREISLGAQAIGTSCVSALVFNDQSSAEKSLETLRATPHVTSAWIYTSKGQPFAEYWRDRRSPPPSLPPLSAGETEVHWFNNRQLTLIRPVSFHGDRVAYVYIQSDYGGLYDQLYHFAEISLGVLLASLLVAYFVSWISRRVIAKPIQDLSETAKVVSNDKNYAVRATPTEGHDEISRLIDTFNTMLARIQERDETLQKTQEQFELALTSAEVGTWTLDIPKQLITWDDHTHLLFGLEPGTFSGKPEDLVKIVHPDDRQNLSQRLTGPGAGDATQESEFRVIWPDGSIHTVATRGKVYRDSTGKGVGRAGACWDTTVRKKAEQALSESEERYRRLFESNPHPMWIYDTGSLAFVAVNDTAVAHYGYSRDEFMRMKISDLRPPEDVTDLPKDEAGNNLAAQKDGVSRHRKKDGTIIHVAVTSHSLPFGSGNTRLVQVEDVTERKKLEDQLRQAQKMEAIGRLAGGVAHDFNNLLTIIGGYGQMLSDQLDPKDSRKAYITEVLNASERAASLTRQLLAFSRQQVLTPRLLDLNALLLNTDKMLRRLIGEDVELTTKLTPGLGRIKADPGQIDQVIVNLAVNSRDAMPKGGKLTIETANIEIDESYVQNHPEVKPGPYVLLAVSDTGMGMDAETQKRIFEPFFTTKEMGKGTGLGLATLYGIVRQSGGFVWVYSELNIGTVFKVYFPRCLDAAETAQSPLPPPPPARGSETILLVEDEEALRKLVHSVLEGKGYNVLAPREAREALAVSDDHGGPIHLLLTDVVMPKMGGRELAEQITSRHPGIKVIFMSGYTNDAIVQHGVLESKVAFLQKPFSPDAVVRKVQEILENG